MIPVLDLRIASGPARAVVRDRLLELTVTDEPGTKSDTLELRFDNRKPRLEIPAKNVEIEVGLGLKRAVRLGTFAVDSVSANGSPASLTVRAKAVSMTAGLKEPKTRPAWRDTTLGAVLTEIAADHGLIPAIAPDLAAQPYAAMSQVTESDLNLITRLAKRYGAVGKPKNGQLLFYARGRVSAARDAVPVIDLTAGNFDPNWSWQSDDRPAFSKVIAWYRDFDAGQSQRITVGSGSPVLTLRETFVNEAAARAAAEARLNAGVRLAGTFSGKLPEGDARLRADGRIKVSGLMPEVDGLWSLTRTVHRYVKDGFQTSLEAEVALEG